MLFWITCCDFLCPGKQPGKQRHSERSMMTGRISTLRTCADTLGESVYRLSSRHTRSRINGVVHSVFSHAVNIVFDGARLVSVVTRDVKGPLNITVPDPNLDFSNCGVRAGMSATLSRGFLGIWDGRLGIDLSTAGVWAAPSTLSVQNVNRCLQNLEVCKGICAGLAGSREPGSNVGRFLSASSVYSGKVSTIGLVRRTMKALGARDGDALVRAALPLLGLGPGLTPSGDDCLCGLLGTAVMLARGRGEEPSWLLGAGRTLSRVARRLTSTLSATYLAHACVGEVTEPVYKAADAVLNAGAETLEDAVAPLLALGASSGYDTLLGICVAIKGLVAREVNQSSSVGATAHQEGWRG